MKRFLIGCGAGFSGDRVDAPGPVVDHLIASGLPGGLMIETLGERTLALAQKSKQKDANAGYEPLLDPLLRPVLQRCLDHGLPIVSNMGAANPRAAAERIYRIASELGCPRPRIAIVTGDDIASQLADLPLQPWDGDDGRAVPADAQVIAANAYLGAERIQEALGAGAQIVITGRVADPALALGMLLHHFGWAEDDWPRLAAGMLAGHIAECGSQVTGGYFADPQKKPVEGMARLGFPIVEVCEDGALTVTKPDNTGGIVELRTVKEQLLYEVHDPAHYITPDVIIDLSGVSVCQEAPDRVSVQGVRGKPATNSYKVTVSYPGGWLGEGEISYAGPGALARARLARDVLRERLVIRGLELRHRFDLIGVASVFDSDDGALSAAALQEPEDIRLRMAVEGGSRAVVEAATQEVLALLCCGPAGGGGVRLAATERIHTISCLAPKSSVQSRMELLP
ncbi:acyclic terpene utilization AtuA family protein [Celeribacter sp.]|uniref:acyclic terpene utilization AtuA family protein n=1 Tax=Celeribacter sp. TaxID=1890673 RepID=UPI003A92ACD4